MPPPATYPLELVQRLVRERLYRITMVAAEGARSLYLDEDDIVACILALRDSEYYKTLPSHKVIGQFQDVYLTRHCGFAIYVKVQVLRGYTHIISFKQDESA